MSAPQQIIQDFINDAKTQLPPAIDKLKTEYKVDKEATFLLDAVYLAGFALIGVLVPSLATAAYGGDADPHYSQDWVRFHALGNLAVALLVVFSRKWNEGSEQADVIKILFVFHSLNATFNIFAGLYGALSKISVLNAAINGFFAYLYFLNGNLKELFGKKSE